MGGDLAVTLNVSDGLLMEFRNQRLTLQTMLSNMQAWLGDTAVLTVAIPQFIQDFDGTLRCIAAFLRLGNGNVHNHFLALSQRHDIARMRETPSHSTWARHSAMAISEMRRFIMESGVFGEQLKIITALYDELLEDGSRLYGCPRTPTTVG